MTDPKEALERLKAYAEWLKNPGPNDDDPYIIFRRKGLALKGSDLRTLITSHDKLEAEVERLEVERNAARDQCATVHSDHSRLIFELETKLDQLRGDLDGDEDGPGYRELERLERTGRLAAESKLAALEEAARPFADVARREDNAMDEMGLRASPDDMLVYDIDQTLTLGQLRVLRTLLDRTGEK